MFLMVDNVDSFVWNLVRYLILAGAEVETRRHDQLDFDTIEQAGYSGIILSPGPGTPATAGQLLPLVRRFMGRIPIMGVCLGHQAIAEACGARIICAKEPMHGKLIMVRHDGKSIYQGLPNPLTVTRYHSLIVDRASVPSCLEICCEGEDGTVMGLRHVSCLLEGVQFHPEAELTEHGLDMLRQFVMFCQRRYSGRKDGGSV